MLIAGRWRIWTSPVLRSRSRSASAMSRQRSRQRLAIGRLPGDGRLEPSVAAAPALRRQRSPQGPRQCRGLGVVVDRPSNPRRNRSSRSQALPHGPDHGHRRLGRSQHVAGNTPKQCSLQPGVTSGAEDDQLGRLFLREGDDRGRGVTGSDVGNRAASGTSQSNGGRLGRVPTFGVAASPAPGAATLNTSMTTSSKMVHCATASVAAALASEPSVARSTLLKRGARATRRATARHREHLRRRNRSGWTRVGRGHGSPTRRGRHARPRLRSGWP